MCKSGWNCVFIHILYIVYSLKKSFQNHDFKWIKVVTVKTFSINDIELHAELELKWFELFSNNYVIRLIVCHGCKAENLQMHWFQLLKREHLLVFVGFYDRKLKIFNFWLDKTIDINTYKKLHLSIFLYIPKFYISNNQLRKNRIHR